MQRWPSSTTEERYNSSELMPKKQIGLSALLNAIMSFIIRYVDWQTGIRVFVPDSDYPLTGLLLRNAQLAFLDSSAFTRA